MNWSIISTVTTMLALGFALTRDYLLTEWRKPKLVLTKEDDSSSLSAEYVFPNRKEVWQLMAVTNIGRRTSADDVEVLLLDVTRLNDESQAGEPLNDAASPTIKNYALKWSLIPTRRLRLGAGVQRWVDLAFAVEVPRYGVQPPTRHLFLPAKDLPWTSDDKPLLPENWSTEGHVLNAGAHRLHLALSAQGITARHYNVDVILKDFDQEPILRNALQIRKVAMLRSRPMRI